MNFTLNGRTVSVESVDVDSRGGRTGILVSVDGAMAGIRGDMASALTLATHATRNTCPLCHGTSDEHGKTVTPTWCDDCGPIAIRPSAERLAFTR